MARRVLGPVVQSTLSTRTPEETRRLKLELNEAMATKHAGPRAHNPLVLPEGRMLKLPPGAWEGYYQPSPFVTRSATRIGRGERSWDVFLAVLAVLIVGAGTALSLAVEPTWLKVLCSAGFVGAVGVGVVVLPQPKPKGDPFLRGVEPRLVPLYDDLRSMDEVDWVVFEAKVERVLRVPRNEPIPTTPDPLEPERR